MKSKVTVWFLTLIVAVTLIVSPGCDGTGTSSLLDATAVQLETSLISGMDSMLTFLMYKAFGIYDQAAAMGGL